MSIRCLVAPAMLGVVLVLSAPAARVHAQAPATQYVVRRPAVTYVQQPAAQPAAVQVQAQPVQGYQVQSQVQMVASGDPYGFTNWLNGMRAQYGLAPVAHDPNLASWAAANNAQQAARGLGHFVMGPARRQNSAVGSAASIGTQWMASPAHRAALLDPSARWIGLAGMGAYWTLNVR